MSQLHYIHLATSRPSVLVHVVAHHPVGRPQSVGRTRKLDTGLDDAMLEGCLVLRRDTSRRETASHIVLAAGRNHETLLATLRVDTHSHIFTAIVLQLLITATIAVYLNVPYILVEPVCVELVTPYKSVAVRHYVHSLCTCCQRQSHRKQHRQKVFA